MTMKKPIKAGDGFTFKGEPVIVAYIYPPTHYQDEQVFMCLFANGSVADIDRTELRDCNIGTPRESTVGFGTMAGSAVRAHATRLTRPHFVENFGAQVNAWLIEVGGRVGAHFNNRQSRPM